MPKWAIFAAIGIGAPVALSIASALASPVLAASSPAVPLKLPIAVTVLTMALYFYFVNMVSMVRHARCNARQQVAR